MSGMVFKDKIDTSDIVDITVIHIQTYCDHSAQIHKPSTSSYCFAPSLNHTLCQVVLLLQVFLSKVIEMLWSNGCLGK